SISTPSTRCPLLKRSANPYVIRMKMQREACAIQKQEARNGTTSERHRVLKTRRRVQELLNKVLPTGPSRRATLDKFLEMKLARIADLVLVSEV
ncbi:unnamed protein product, partial [Amoebophrya sp. A120]